MMKKILKTLIAILIFIPLLFGSILLFSNGNIKYSKEIQIDSPIELVNKLFADIYNMKQYMPTTKDIILLEGEDGQEGAQYKIIVQAGEKLMEMSGTLKNNNLPDSIVFHYEMPGVLNIMKQRHIQISEEKTLIINEQEFQFKGAMKILAFFKPTGFNLKAFETQTQSYLKLFKYFIENNKED